MARDIDGVIKIKFANAGDVGLGGLDLNELWPVAYSTPGGPFPQRVQINQLFRYLSALAVEINSKGPFLDWDGTAVTGPDYAVGAVVRGSDGNNYDCLIANGPASAIVDPVGDLTGTWSATSEAYATAAEVSAGILAAKKISPLTLQTHRQGTITTPDQVLDIISILTQVSEKNRATSIYPFSSFLSTPTGTHPGTQAFTGGVLLPDGRVFCVPRNSTTARIYDPVEDTLITPTGTYPGSEAFAGGVLLPDGRVFCVPRDSTTTRIYDPVLDSLSTPTGTYPGSDAFYGGVLLPDGKVFCVPLNATTARIYDPVLDSLSTPTGTYPGSAAFYGGVLLPDGKVFCVPYSATTARIYDPVLDSLSTPAGTYPGTGAFAGGVLLPDGKVFCVPRNSTTTRIYDPVEDTLITPTGTYPGSDAFAGGVLLPDGRAFCVPYNSTTARILSGGFSVNKINYPYAYLTGAFLNKL